MKTMLAALLVTINCALAQTNVGLVAQTVRITAIEKGISTYAGCVINGESVLVKGLPPTIATSYASVARLETEVKTLTSYVETQDKKIRAAQANGPATAASGTDGGNYIRYWNIQANNLTDKEKELEKKKDALELERKNFEKISEIEAFDTKQSYGGKRIWIVKTGIKVATDK